LKKNWPKDRFSSQESNGVVGFQKKICFNGETTFFFEGPIETHVLITLGRKNDYSDQIRPISKSAKISLTVFCKDDYSMKIKDFLKKKSARM
jgi:hypothetical protein